jgi:hypothetical protein
MLIFPIPVGLDGDDLAIKQALNKGLKLKKILIDFGFMIE